MFVCDQMNLMTPPIGHSFGIESQPGVLPVIQIELANSHEPQRSAEPILET